MSTLLIDDIIVHSREFGEAIKRLCTLLQGLRDAGLKLSPKKCILLQHSVPFLGHVVSNHGVYTDSKKIKAVRTWPSPCTAKDVKSFLGLCSYYRRFVRGFADIARPLYRLTENQREFWWTSECEDAFRRLKTLLTTAPILAFPTADGLFILDTDASNTGLGTVLSQIQEGEEKVIAFHSKSLSKSERNYCVTRKGLLAVVVAVKTYHHYLCGRQFLVRTDHGALKWLLKFKNPEGQLARWLELLGTYDFNIQHRSGICHGNAVALSRRPCGDCRYCDRAEQKGESSSAADSETTDAVLCGASQGSDKTTDGDSLPFHQLDPKPLPEGQEFQNGSSSSTKAFVVMGTTSDLRASQIADDDLRNIITWKESATLARRGRMCQLKANPSRVTGVNGTICHYVTVSFAGGGNRKQEMRSVDSLLYPPISETTSSTSFTPRRPRDTWVSTRRYKGLKEGSIGLGAQKM